MIKNNKHQLSIPLLFPIGLLLVLFAFTQWKSLRLSSKDQNSLSVASQPPILNDSTEVDRKQKGAHIFTKFNPIDFQILTRNNIEWVTLVPWGFQDDHNSAKVNHHNGDSLQIQQSNASWLQQLEQVRSAGFKVFVKPHVWIDNPSDGKWRSDIFPSNDENWELWKSTYRDFILRYASLAEEGQAEMFCIGTEFSRLSVEKPNFWKALIQEVRNVYSGKITYAANWYQEYEDIHFWNKLDYIGIQAYFPLVKNEYPTVQQISDGWNKYLSDLSSVHKKYNRRIIFTEMGYKSTADSAIKPWEWMDDPYSTSKSYSYKTQENCYQAFFNTIWPKPWIAGVHIWNLRDDKLEEHPDKKNLDFTPIGKPAEKVIAKGFE